MITAGRLRCISKCCSAPNGDEQSIFQVGIFALTKIPVGIAVIAIPAGKMPEHIYGVPMTAADRMIFKCRICGRFRFPDNG